MDTMAMARSERSELADLLESLTPEQWVAPSLCTGWRVCDVAAHAISYEEDSRTDLLRRLVRVRGRVGRLNDLARAAYADLGQAELVAFYRDHLVPRGSTARFDGAVGLVDGLIHHQDIRRPLGLPREIPEERLAKGLDFAVFAPPLRGFWHARGVRLVATDLDWSRGKGPEARGPAEAVLMTLAGRVGVAGELSGPGREVLVERLG